MSSKRILLTHTPKMRADYYGPRALEGLRAQATLVLNESDRPLDPDGIVKLAEGCRIVVTDRNTPVPAAVFERLPSSVVAVERCAVDIRNIDVEAASRAGVLVTHASPGFIAAVAEMAFGQMIDLARGITRSATTYHKGEIPVARMGRQLAGSTLGLIGYGAIARQIAGIAQAFGMTVVAHDPYITSADAHVQLLPLDDVVAAADFLLPMAVATPETENLVDAALIGRMKRSAFLVNLSRGNLIDEAALAAALDAGRIAGAAMDVGRAPDQMPSPELAGRSDVIATPHTGGLTPPAIEHQALETVRQATDILAGRLPEGAVNAASAGRFRKLADI